jgi:Nucleotidyl transferase AbiEii toxin, Type IV TA system
VRVAEIRDAQEYGGFRVLLTAQLGTAVLPLQIDVGFGDAITPAPTTTNFPVVAEKFEALVQLGMTNSRMKDYYDLLFVSRHFEFEGVTLASAIRATFKRRATAIPGGSPVGLTAEFARDPAHTRQWAAFTARLGAGAFPPLSEVIDEIREFVLPPATAASANQPFMRHWKPNERWQPVG